MSGDAIRETTLRGILQCTGELPWMIQYRDHDIRIVGAALQSPLTRVATDVEDLLGLRGEDRRKLP